MQKLEELKEVLESMNVGNTLLMSARPVANGKYSLEFVEKIYSDATNALSRFNKSDVKFTGTTLLRSWLTAEKKDAEDILGISFSDYPLQNIATADGEVREVHVIGLMNPTDEFEERIRIEIRETIIGTTWDLQNPLKSIKRDNSGNFLLYNGDPIYRKTDVVIRKPQHTLITHTEKTQPTITTDSVSFGDTSVPVEATEEAEVQA